MMSMMVVRSILHVFKNPTEYQPERYLKDGKLNPDVKDRDSVAFGYGCVCVYIVSDIHRVSLSIFPAFARENS